MQSVLIRGHRPAISRALRASAVPTAVFACSSQQPRAPRRRNASSVSSNTPAVVEQTLDSTSHFLSPVIDPCVSFLLSHPLPTFGYTGTIVLLTLALRSSVTLPTAMWARARMRRFREHVIPRMKLENETLAIEVLKRCRREKKGYDEYKKELKSELAMRQKALVKAFQCHPTITALVPAAIHIPLFLILSFSIRQAVLAPAAESAPIPASDIPALASLGDFIAPASPMASESLLWIPTLVEPDPTLYLPFALGLLAFSNAEIMQSWRRTMQSQNEQNDAEPVDNASSSLQAAPSRQILAKKLNTKLDTAPPVIQDETAAGNMSSEERKQRDMAIQRGSMRERIVSNVLRIFSVATIGIAAELPAAVVLYWFTSTGFSVAQNVTLNTIDKKRYMASASPAKPARTAATAGLRLSGARSFSTSAIRRERRGAPSSVATDEDAIPARLLGSRQELERKKTEAQSKYADKLRQRMEAEGVSSLEELQAKIKPTSEPQQPTATAAPTASTPRPAARKAAASQEQAAADRAGVKPLGKILNLDVVYNAPHTDKDIASMWQLYHSSHPTLADTFLSANIPPSTYASMIAVARENPSFVIPLPRSEGEEGAFEMFYMQWIFHPTVMPPATEHDAQNRTVARLSTTSVIFTPLAEYREASEWAQPHLALTHYPDLHNNPIRPDVVADTHDSQSHDGSPQHHDLVLMRGEIAPAKEKSALTSPLPNQSLALTQQQAQLLALAVQRFYCADIVPSGESEKARQEREERKKSLVTFRTDPANWDWKGLVALAFGGFV